MNTTDIHLFETGSGGDFAIVNNDLLMGESLYQQIYLALFGGNIQASTKQSYLESEERSDYWGNSLIWKDVKTKQFNSETERTLGNIALNSSGRLSILQAVNNDLDYLKGVVDFAVEVGIDSVSRISITVNFKEKTNQQDKVLQMVWNNSKNEVIITKLI
jgi:phage gp46-like protein